ncbi:DUF4124 domain-containing protein [Thermomonas fusca]|uniref:DUF4124 domain-containing protein n=1 Tax=Thermomonas fusca TaxID=215690 RepID=A0A5R9PFT2_9GAMM|nr:DUF4124 domain-containing protein [Thermomonas fusca]TLX22384.1 DUF4124 domain-containing protein [Thermomonas fusca]
MRPLLLIGLLLFVPHAQAESLYRCVGRDGAVSYQSRACAARQRLDRVVEYRAEPGAARSGGVPEVSRRQPRRYANGSGGNRIVRVGGATTASQRCRAGKAKREAALQRLGLKRSYDQLSALDMQVRAVCGGY